MSRAEQSSSESRRHTTSVEWEKEQQTRGGTWRSPWFLSQPREFQFQTMIRAFGLFRKRPLLPLCPHFSASNEPGKFASAFCVLLVLEPNSTSKNSLSTFLYIYIICLFSLRISYRFMYTYGIWFMLVCTYVCVYEHIYVMFFRIIFVNMHVLKYEYVCMNGEHHKDWYKIYLPLWMES